MGTYVKLPGYIHENYFKKKYRVLFIFAICNYAYEVKELEWESQMEEKKKRERKRKVELNQF